MPEILEDAFSAEAEIAPLTNLFDFFRHLENSTRTEFYRGERIVRWNSPLAHPWFRGSLLLQHAQPGDAELVAETAAYFQDAGVPGFSLWLEPQLLQEPWDALLREAGFSYSDDTPGMVVDLEKLTPHDPTGIEIRRVENPAELEIWATTVATGFGMAGAAGQLVELMDGIGLDHPLRNYSGFIDGAPVAASSLFLATGVAGIYNVATLPDARGKGAGAAMTLAPLYDAREMGYRVGILQSSDMGFRIYERLGFRTTCKVGNYYKALSTG